MTYEQATCFPVALQTMHNAVVTAGRFKLGETLLVQGASSGVGLMGMQIGKLMGASLVIGTSTNAQRRARLKEFSCDLALDSGDPKWPEQVKEGTGGKGVDLIVDMVSGGVANQNLEAAALLVRIVNVGRLGGMTGEFNFDLHALKRIDYIGVTFRTRSLDEIREINRLMRADLWLIATAIRSLRIGHLIYVSVDRLYQRPSLFVRHYLVMLRAPMRIDPIPSVTLKFMMTDGTLFRSCRIGAHL
jgi:NADPH2:quinone reductase